MKKESTIRKEIYELVKIMRELEPRRFIDNFSMILYKQAYEAKHALSWTLSNKRGINSYPSSKAIRDSM